MGDREVRFGYSSADVGKPGSRLRWLEQLAAVLDSVPDGYEVTIEKGGMPTGLRFLSAPVIVNNKLYLVGPTGQVPPTKDQADVIDRLLCQTEPK